MIMRLIVFRRIYSYNIYKDTGVSIFKPVKLI